MPDVPDFTKPVPPQHPYGAATGPVPLQQPHTQPLPQPPPAPVHGQVVPAYHQHPGQVVPFPQPTGHQGPPVIAVVQAPGTKDTGVAYLLWFFLGGVGGDRFYVGRTGEGVFMLGAWLLGWLTVWFLVGYLFFFAVGVWALVNAFRIPGDIRLANARAMQRLQHGFR